MVEPSLELLQVMMPRMLDKMSAFEFDMREMKHRMSTVEARIGAFVSSEQSDYATVMARMDQTEARLKRIERRLDLFPSAA